MDEAKRIVELAPDGRLFEGAGHLLSLEQPERFNDVLLEFLGRVSSGPSGSEPPPPPAASAA